jgi:hypothetical protein
MLLVSAVTLGLFGFLHPVVADEGAPASGFPGFTVVDATAQGQLATGFLFAVGDEANSLVGSAVEINGPPAGSQAISAFFLRGKGATYVYGVAGGGGNGKGGALPEPPPGDAEAFFPANPQQAAWEGPLTGALKTQVVDGRFTSKVTDAPTARGDAAVTTLEVPGALKIEHAVVDSHSEITDSGVIAESVSVLRGVTVGPLHIESMVSRAYGFIAAAPGPPKGIARTVVEGATVNGTSVQVTDQGLVVGPNTSPGAQAQVNDAIAKAGFPQIRLTPSLVAPGADNGSVHAVTGELQVVHKDEKLGAQNPQGFSGGGFSVGGAEVQVLGTRCAPNCQGGTGGPPDLSAPPTAQGGPPPAAIDRSPSFEASPPSTGYGSSAASSTTAVTPPAPSEPSTTDVVPPVTEPSTPPVTQPAPAPPVQQAAPSAPRRTTLAATQLTPDVAGWMRDAYLAVAAVLLAVLLAGTLLIRAR